MYSEKSKNLLNSISKPNLSTILSIIKYLARNWFYSISINYFCDTFKLLKCINKKNVD